MPPKQALAIQARLRAFVREEFGTQYELIAAGAASRSTATAWFGKRVVVPDVLSLQPLVRRGLSIDWLFTGEGYPRRLPATADASAAFEAIVLAHLPPAEPTTKRRRTHALRMVRRYEGREGGVARFAHAAIRVQFAALMDHLRVYDDLKRWGDEDDRRDEAMEPVVAQLFAFARAAGYGDQLPAFDLAELQAKRWDRRRHRLRRIHRYLLDHLPTEPADPARHAFRQLLTEFTAMDRELESDPLAPAPQPEGGAS